MKSRILARVDITGVLASRIAAFHQGEGKGISISLHPGLEGAELPLLAYDCSVGISLKVLVFMDVGLDRSSRWAFRYLALVKLALIE